MLRSLSLAAMTWLFAANMAYPALAAPSCTLYEDRDYGGAWIKLRHRDILQMINPPDVGTSDAIHRYRYEDAWNDDVSSFRVDPGCTLTMWEHVGPGGARFRASRSYNYVGSSWNDKASEARCDCGRSGPNL